MCVILIINKRKVGMAVIFLYIFLAIVAIVALVILVVYYAPISLQIRYDNMLRLYERIYFVKIKEYPKKKKKRKKKKAAANVSPNTSVTGQTEAKSSPLPDISDDDDDEDEFESVESVKDTLALFIELLKQLFDIVGEDAKIKINKLSVTVSKPDAADTAVLYGVCGGMVSTVLAVASNFSKCKINEKNVGVTADFIGGKNSIDIDITLSARVIVVYSCLLKAYMIHEAKKRKSQRMEDINNDKRSEHS